MIIRAVVAVVALPLQPKFSMVLKRQISSSIADGNTVDITGLDNNNAFRYSTDGRGRRLFSQPFTPLALYSLFILFTAYSRFLRALLDTRNEECVSRSSSSWNSKTASLGGTHLNASIGVRAGHVMCVIVLGFGATHKAVAKMEVVNRMLCKQVPTKVLLIVHTPLGGIGACVPNVPHVPVVATVVHGLADTAVPNRVHAGHDVTIECTDALKLVARNRKARERGARLLGLFGLVWRPLLVVPVLLES